MRLKLLAAAYWAAMGAIVLCIGLLGSIYIADQAAAGWRGCGLGGVGSWNAGVVEDVWGANGPGIAATVSCDMQIDKFVVGAAAEYGWKRFDWAGNDVDAKGWAATGRAGVLVTNAVLVYGLGGYTQVTAELGPWSVDLAGLVAGGGVEIDLTRGFFGRLEYQRLMLEPDDGDIEANVDSIRVGLTYKFGLPDDPFAVSKPLK